MNRIEKLISGLITNKIFSRPENIHVANNTFWILVERLMRIAMGLITGIIVARYLGPEASGKLNFALVILAILYPIYTLSIDSIVIKDLSAGQIPTPQIFGTVLALRLTFSFICFIVYNCVQYVFNQGDNETLFVGFVLSFSVFFQVLEFIEPVFHWHLKSKYAMYAKGLIFLLFSVVKLVLVGFNAPLYTFAVAYMAEMSLSAVLAFVIARIKFKRYTGNFMFQSDYARYILSMFPLMVAQTLFIQFINKIDQVLIKNRIAPDIFGQYTIAMRMIEFSTFIPMALYASYMPILTKAFAQDEKLYLSKSENYFHVMFYLAIFAAVGVYFLGNPVLSLLFGTSYYLAGSMFAAAFIKVAFNYVLVALGSYFLIQNQHKLFLYFLGISAFLHLVFSFIGMVLFDWYGSIWGVNLAGIATVTIILLYTRKKGYFLSMCKHAMHPFLLLNKQI